MTPSSFEALLDWLQISGKSRDLLQRREPPPWMLRATTLAKELEEASAWQVPCFTGRLWKVEDPSGDRAWRIRVNAPMPTLRGPLQRGWPLETAKFISELRSKKKAKGAYMLAQAMGLGDDYLLSELS